MALSECEMRWRYAWAKVPHTHVRRKYIWLSFLRYTAEAFEQYTIEIIQSKQLDVGHNICLLMSLHNASHTSRNYKLTEYENETNKKSIQIYILQ